MAGTDAGRRDSGEYLQVQTTTDSRAEAMELARAAVEARLAACGQVAGPVASTYWWNEELERAEEWFVFFKLPADRYEALAAFLAERHSYDEPEIVATSFAAGSASFLSWITDETRPRDQDAPDSDGAADIDTDGAAGASVPLDSDVPRPRAPGAPSTSDVTG
jgi:periplasmic divalent cation tolerance protein